MVARILGILIALALLAGGGYVLYRSFIATSSTEETPIRTVKVERRDIRQIVRCVGEVEPALYTDLKAEVSGRIERLLVEEGDRVEKGQDLIELDRRELETQIQEAAHRIEAARLRMEKVKLDYEAKKELFEKSFAPKREFLDAEIDYLLAKNELEIQKSQHRLLEEKLTKTIIKAPHSGVVLDHRLTEGMVITGVSSFSEGTVLMRVAQLDELQVETEISEVDVDKVKKSMPVTLNFDSLPDTELKGKITFISPSAKPKGASGNAGSSRGNSGSGNTATTARVFPITVAFSAGEARVRPGMTAQVELVVEEVSNVLSAELPSVFVEDGQSFVYVKNADSFERKEVETGISDHHVVELAKGIEEGDELATVRPQPAKDENEAADAS